MLSALANQAPILAQTEFLSYFVFPFVKTFENDLVAAFEVVYTILSMYFRNSDIIILFHLLKILIIIHIMLLVKIRVVDTG